MLPEGCASPSSVPFSMSLTLATLRRGAGVVLLNSSYRLPLAGVSWLLHRVEFRRIQEAIQYLRFWKEDARAMTELRNALSRFRNAPVSRMTNDEVIHGLAVHLVRGELLVGTGRADYGLPPTGADAAAASAAAVAAIAPAPPPPPLPASLLPKLEEVEIEGAQVLPEVLQTMEQLEATIAEIEVATVPLEPAPSGVTAINDALTNASSSVTSTLDEL